MLCDAFFLLLALPVCQVNNDMLRVNEGGAEARKGIEGDLKKEIN